MSNVAKVVPYVYTDATSARLLAELTSTALAAIRWLTETRPEDRAAAHRLKEELRNERLHRSSRVNYADANPGIRNLAAVSLRVRNTDSLQRSAEKMGYRIVNQASGGSQVSMARAAGERLVIGRDERGQTFVTARTDDHVKALIRQHTTDKAIQHLKSKGMSVQKETLPNGDVQILAQERAARRDGSAEVRTRIYRDGTAQVDVDKIRGSRCEDIVSELADAVGGEVSELRKKDSHSQLPVKPVVEVKV